MFSTSSSKICCSFAKNKIFENVQDGSQIGEHVVKTAVAMATVLNQNLIFVMESKELIQSYFHAKA